MTFDRPEIRKAARGLLLVGVAAPMFAFAAVLIAAVCYADFNHARQYLSELGGATAAYPWIFIIGVMILFLERVRPRFGASHRGTNLHTHRASYRTYRRPK